MTWWDLIPHFTREQVAFNLDEKGGFHIICPVEELFENEPFQGTALAHSLV